VSGRNLFFLLFAVLTLLPSGASVSQVIEITPADCPRKIEAPSIAFHPSKRELRDKPGESVRVTVTAVDPDGAQSHPVQGFRPGELSHRDRQGGGERHLHLDRAQVLGFSLDARGVQG